MFNVCCVEHAELPPPPPHPAKTAKTVKVAARKATRLCFLLNGMGLLSLAMIDRSRAKSIGGLPGGWAGITSHKTQLKPCRVGNADPGDCKLGAASNGLPDFLSLPPRLAPHQGCHRFRGVGIAIQQGHHSRCDRHLHAQALRPLHHRPGAVHAFGHMAQ